MHQPLTHSKALVQEEGQGEEWKSSIYTSLMKLHSVHMVLVFHLDTLGIFA